jgi:hypothetical protein
MSHLPSSSRPSDLDGQIKIIEMSIEKAEEEVRSERKAIERDKEALERDKAALVKETDADLRKMLLESIPRREDGINKMQDGITEMQKTINIDKQRLAAMEAEQRSLRSGRDPDGNRAKSHVTMSGVTKLDYDSIVVGLTVTTEPPSSGSSVRGLRPFIWRVGTEAQQAGEYHGYVERALGDALGAFDLRCAHGTTNLLNCKFNGHELHGTTDLIIVVKDTTVPAQELVALIELKTTNNATATWEACVQQGRLELLGAATKAQQGPVTMVTDLNGHCTLLWLHDEQTIKEMKYKTFAHGAFALREILRNAAEVRNHKNSAVHTRAGRLSAPNAVSLTPQRITFWKPRTPVIGGDTADDGGYDVGNLEDLEGFGVTYTKRERRARRQALKSHGHVFIQSTDSEGEGEDDEEDSSPSRNSSNTTSTSDTPSRDPTSSTCATASNTTSNDTSTSPSGTSSSS